MEEAFAKDLAQARNNPNKKTSFLKKLEGDLSSAQKNATDKDDKKILSDIADIVKHPFRLTALIKYINPFLDWLFIAALIVALLKDILDCTQLMDVTLINWIVSPLFSITIFLILILTGATAHISKSRSYAKVVIKYCPSVLSLFFEIIPAVDILPVETFTVLFSFYFTLKQREDYAEEEELQRQINEREQENLDLDIAYRRKKQLQMAREQESYA